MPSYSDLQRLQDDPTANAPQATFDAAAAEVDHRRLSESAPQQAVAHEPEVRFSDAQPEAIGASSDGDKETVNLDRLFSTSVAARWRRRRLWVLVAFVLLCTSGIAIGLGVGLTHRGSLQSSIPAPQASNAPHEHGIRDGSSIAAATQKDGTKVVVFQDIHGVVRQAVMNTSGNTWDTHFNMLNLVTTDARPLTPLAAVTRFHTSFLDSQGLIYLFYVNTYNTLDVLLFNGVGDFGPDASPWGGQDGMMDFTGIAPFEISPQSQDLSVAVLIDTADFSFGVLLMLQQSDNKILALYAHEKNTTGLPEPLVWTNITDSFIPERPDDGILSSNLINQTFSNICVLADGSHEVSISSFTDNANCPYVTVVWSQATFINTTNPPNFKQNITICADLRNMTILQADSSSVTALKDTEVISLRNGSTTQLQSLLPFSISSSIGNYSNLAVTPPVSASSPVYAYQQINASAFGEEQWSAESSNWTVKVVQVDTSVEIQGLT